MSVVADTVRADVVIVGDRQGPATGVGGRVLALEPEELAEHAPDGVHVLITSGHRAGWPERWELRGGVHAIVCYSSVLAVHAACGATQPSRWVASADIAALCAAARADVVVLDEPLPEPPRYPETDAATVPDLPELDASDADLIYVPSRPVRRGDRRVDLELQPHRGERTLLAYTTPEELREGCGPYQPYVAVHAGDLPEVMVEAGAERVLFNPVLAEKSRHDTPVRRPSTTWST